jgi:hypothetical protein
MRKHTVRVVLDPATDHALIDAARRQSRPVANMAFALIKSGLENLRRAEQRPAAERTEPSQSN